jgi:hypothetical protein
MPDMIALFTEPDEELERQLDRDAQERATFDSDPYLQLPPAVRGTYSRTEFLWLSDYEKATLVARECDPEF